MEDAKPKPRRELPAIKVRVSEIEREIIIATAESVGLSVSAYLRRLGLGYQPKSMVDLQRVEAMLKVAGDAGRLGGLLKMWLADDQRLKTFAPVDMRPKIQQALAKIGEAQTEIRAIAETVLKARE